MKVKNIEKITFGSHTAYVGLPDSFDSTKTYSVFIGIAGGNQEEANINFFHEVYFSNDHLSNKIIVLPISSDLQPVHEFNREQILDFIHALKIKFNTSDEGWMVAGTSNGGRAAFKFIAALPSLFSGVIVAPGELKDCFIINDWTHIIVILAYGSKDSEAWKQGVINTKNLLENKVAYLEVIELSGAAHIIKKGFSINHLYTALFREYKKIDHGKN
ncbi:MAG: hypothetical protein K2P88_11980 [Chitinophagaceae bacterium]|jgi:predicted esterase|nr:hypothetical protein [Chitinophagaceae bacterium]